MSLNSCLLNSQKFSHHQTNRLKLLFCATTTGRRVSEIYRNEKSKNFFFRVEGRLIKIIEKSLCLFLSHRIELNIFQPNVVIVVDPVASGVRDKIQVTNVRQNANLVVHFELDY